MKQFISLLLVVLMLFCFAGCEEGIPSTDGTPAADPQEDVVIFDNDKVKVTYLGIKEIDVETIGYSYLNLKIENKTDTEIWVTMPYCCVDNETVPFVLQGTTSIYVNPGKTYPATFGIQVFNLSIDSLKNASEIEFTIKAVAKEDIMNTVFEETMKIEINK